MRDRFELGTTVPHDEPCSQVGSEGYLKNSRLEAQALKALLLRTLPPPPEGTAIRVIECPHDFGTYLDLAVTYDDENEESTDWMLKAESGVPANWDDEAIDWLRENGYRFPGADEDEEEEEEDW
jgi:hypothetical protein